MMLSVTQPTDDSADLMQTLRFRRFKSAFVDFCHELKCNADCNKRRLEYFFKMTKSVPKLVSLSLSYLSSFSTADEILA